MVKNSNCCKFLKYKLLFYNITNDKIMINSLKKSDSALAQLMKTSLDLAAANGTAVKVNAGGLQVGGGLRLFF